MGVGRRKGVAGIKESSYLKNYCDIPRECKTYYNKMSGWGRGNQGNN